MAKVTGPLMSMSASGTIGKALTYGTWKGQAWVRKWFTPENPNTQLQQNVRKALTLLNAYWQASIDGSARTAYEVGAAGTGISGWNLYIKRGMNQYITQLTSAVDPLSVTVAGEYPSDVFTWLPVV